MKISIYSDLHNEFSKFIPPLSSKDAELIILAGDIDKGDQGILWARQQWPAQHIIYVAGNHEFYGQERNGVLKSLRAVATEHNVHFLENDEVFIDGIRFIGCTLWTDFKLFGDDLQQTCMREAQSGLNDFSLIKEGQSKFLPESSLVLFNESYAFLKRKLLSEHYAGKTVVITHHLPSMLSVAYKYKEDLLSACFASNLDDLFGSAHIWTHGHTHESFDYEVKGTRVICNPRGYSRFDRDVENTNFIPNLEITL